MSLAFVFPGQGSQSPGMLDSFKNNLIVKKTIEEASDGLKVDFHKIIYGDDPNLMNLTVNTQPIILTISISLWRVYCERNGPVPSVMAGHSLGEYSALTASGVLSFEQALELVSFRAKSMQKAVPTGLGGMAAIIGLSGDIVKKLCVDCSRSDLKAEPANFNSSEQTVISGANEIIEKVCARAKECGARRAVRLAVSAPFHSTLMESAARDLKGRLIQEKLCLPKIPVINNVDVEVLRNENQIKSSLSKQVMSVVRWNETIQKFHKMGVICIVECGPGKVLTGLSKRICPNVRTFSLYNDEIINEVISSLAK